MLRAGINKASHLVVVNRETADKSCGGEETLADSETIIAVQTVFRMFPNANIITELSQASNMRFMQFSAQDIYLQKVSKLEQVQSINIVIKDLFILADHEMKKNDSIDQIDFRGKFCLQIFPRKKCVHT